MLNALAEHAAIATPHCCRGFYHGRVPQANQNFFRVRIFHCLTEFFRFSPHPPGQWVFVRGKLAPEKYRTSCEDSARFAQAKFRVSPMEDSDKYPAVHVRMAWRRGIYFRPANIFLARSASDVLGCFLINSSSRTLPASSLPERRKLIPCLSRAAGYLPLRGNFSMTCW